MSFFSAIRSVLTLGKGVAVGLDELQVAADPIAFFGKWHNDAVDSGMLLPEAMTLATCTPEGKPSARMVLLKQADEDGFIFFTNYGSRKASELNVNPHAALVFHWNVLQRQVRVEGPVERVSEEESDAYFQSRARGSRIGAWASRQSTPVEYDGQLLQRVKDMEEKFAGDEVPLPSFWGGYRLRPQAVEFWQGRANRLHDRLKYQRQGGEWQVERLFP